jgi:hypothetical protein
MIHATMRLNHIRFDQRGFRRDLERAIISLMHGAMREWLRAALTENNPGYFPVWSGMAKSSFKPLADYLEVPLEVTPVEGAPDRRAEGESLGRQSNFLTISRNQYGAYSYNFTWTTEVPHFEFLEFAPHPNVASAPWESTKAGARAAQAYLDAYTERRIPQIGDYLITSNSGVV